MEKTKIIYITLFFGAILMGCNRTEFAHIPTDKIIKKDPAKATISIDQLKSTYMANSKTLFGVNEIKSDTDVIIEGVVTSTDTEGNIYKYLTIQEITKGGGAIKISIDAGSLSGVYPLGQYIQIKCNGLVVGNYAQSAQMGVTYKNERKGRTEPGRIPVPIAENAITAYGLPNPKAIQPDTMTIQEIIDEGNALANKLVVIKNAYFTGRGADFGQPATISDNEKIFAPSTGGIGYPQSREIKDDTGSLFISTSEYAKFANYPLPSSNLKGEITAIVGWYNDRDQELNKSKIYDQLTLRTLNDLGKGFEEYHRSME